MGFKPRLQTTVLLAGIFWIEGGKTAPLVIEYVKLPKTVGAAVPL